MLLTAFRFGPPRNLSFCPDESSADFPGEPEYFSVSGEIVHVLVKYKLPASKQLCTAPECPGL
jgi:hypothetical protein